jgi:hypothetical protein
MYIAYRFIYGMVADSRLSTSTGYSHVFVGSVGALARAVHRSLCWPPGTAAEPAACDTDGTCMPTRYARTNARKLAARVPVGGTSGLRYMPVGRRMRQEGFL